MKAENWFLLLGLVFGLMFIILTPPFQVLDEQDHFFTAYAISQGQSRSANAQIPTVFIDMWESVKDMRFHLFVKTSWSELKPFLSAQSYEPYIPVSLYATRFYSSVVYFPQALGVSLATMAELPPLIVFWTGRLFALLFWLLVIYCGLMIAPTFKWVLLFISLSPISLFTAASYSADSSTNALSFFMIAVLLKAASSDWNQIDFKRTILLTLTFLPFTVLKFPYINLLVLLCLISPRKFVKKRYFWFLMLAAGSSLMFWFLRVNLFSHAPLFGIHENTAGNLPVQLEYILKHPFAYLEILINTLSLKLGWYLATFAGVLGWVDTIIPLPAILLFYFILVILPFVDNRQNLHISNASKGVLLITSVLVIVGIFTTMYLTWTEVQAPIVDGVQGRYFIPVSPVLGLAAYNQQFKIPEKWLILIVSVSIFLILSASSYALGTRYFS